MNEAMLDAIDDALATAENWMNAIPAASNSATKKRLDKALDEHRRVRQLLSSYRRSHPTRSAQQHGDEHAQK